MGIKRDKLDKVFSDCVRERDSWTCTRCGLYFPEGTGRRSLHCSHIFSRRHRLTRCDPMNAVAHCVTCHRYLTENPVEFTRWVERYCGDGVIEILQEKLRQNIKITKADREEMHIHFKAEFARMKRERAAGEVGNLELPAFL